ncbi:serine/threonine-protein kinase [Microcoleus sp. FACHB-831]|uniref:serine/threonine-protein kinase n=1 Tax=Microcoleus sp. FACHB-831 TaxID=2692827 RepID=UPI00281637C3|nr:serine/threonine-protein kinase [Microcoleus sp. FACHB-831]
MPYHTKDHPQHYSSLLARDPPTFPLRLILLARDGAAFPLLLVLLAREDTTSSVAHRSHQLARLVVLSSFWVLFENNIKLRWRVARVRAYTRRSQFAPQVIPILARKRGLSGRSFVTGFGATMIGRLLDGRYRIVEVLGSGAFGRTYLAADTRRPGQPQCVVKQLQPPHDNPQLFKTALRLFKREAETLEKLGKHDQIPQLLAYFEDSKQFYLVEEFVPGHPLTQEIVAGQPLTEAAAIRLLLDVLEILVFVHGQGVIHRDVNPSNIIRRQTDGKLVLIDFGSVKEVSTQILNSQGQMPRTIATGTPAYMPMEQFQGHPQFSSDIYAVGMIAIQALTGLPAGDLPKLQNQKPQDSPNDNAGKVVWQHRANVSPELAEIIDKMVCSYFGHRYQSAIEVLNGLVQVGVKFGIPSPLQSIVSAKQKVEPVRRRGVNWLVLGGTAALLIAGGLAFALYSRFPDTLMAQKLISQGVDKGKAGNYQGAIADYNQALKVKPDNSAAYYHRGAAYYSQGQRQQALDDFTQAIQINPQYAEAYNHRGKARFDVGDDQGSLKDFNQAIQLDPKLASAYVGRGNVRAGLGNEQQAIEDYNKAIQLDPKEPKTYLNRCLSHSNIGEQQQAVEDCTQAIQLKPNYAFAYQNRGLARRRLGDVQGAIEDFNVAIQIDPQDADPYYNRGISRSELGDKQGAIEDFNQAIARNTNHALVYYDRGLVRASVGDKQGAIKDFQQSAKLCLDQGKLSCYKDAQYQIGRLQQSPPRP